MFKKSHSVQLPGFQIYQAWLKSFSPPVDEKWNFQSTKNYSPPVIKKFPSRCETAAQSYLLNCVSSCQGFKSKACAKSQPGELDGYSFGTAFLKQKPRQLLSRIITKKNGYNLKTSGSRSAPQFVSTGSRLKKHRRLIYL